MDRTFGTFLLQALLVLSTLLGLLVFFLMEVVFGEPIGLSWYLRFGFVWFFLLLAQLHSQPLRKILRGFVAMLLVLTVFYAAPWSTRKPFLKKFNRIQKGMSRQEVLQVMDGYETSSQGDIWYFRPRPSCRFDSDFGRVKFEKDAVSEKSFLAD